MILLRSLQLLFQLVDFTRKFEFLFDIRRFQTIVNFSPLILPRTIHHSHLMYDSVAQLAVVVPTRRFYSQVRILVRHAPFSNNC
jgi:hypothetical protein